MTGLGVDRLFWIFAAIWGVAGIASWLFFSRGRDSRLKRQAFLPVNIAAATMFLCMSWGLGIQGGELLLIAAFAAVATFMNLRATRFCDACGATNIGRTGISPPAHCSECGAALRR